MAEFKPVQTVDDFRTLDDGEILEGYLQYGSLSRIRA